MSDKKINQMPLLEATTKQQKILLGIIQEHTKQIEYGSLTIEIGVRAGKMDRLKVTNEQSTYNIGMRDNQ